MAQPRRRSFLGGLIDKARSRSGSASSSTPPPIRAASSSNVYLTAGGLPAASASDQSLARRAGTVYEGLKTVFQGLYDTSDMFLPLKTAAGVLLWICETVDMVLDNRTELEDFQAKLTAILAVVTKYKRDGGISALDLRIKMFCEAIDRQMQAVKTLQQRSLATRTAERNKDAKIVSKALRDMNSICDIFQMDTQLNIEGRVEDIDIRVRTILQVLNTGSINQLRHDMVSYKTRHSSYGDPSGCMPGTRERILADLETWALDENSSKLYWLVGIAGTGKSAISQTYCEILQHKNILGASFFCSRGTDQARNARLIIPSVAYSLAMASPPIKAEILKAITDDPTLAETNYNDTKDQLNKLVLRPLQVSLGQNIKTYKVVVIDALDECSDLRRAAALIRTFHDSMPQLPLKILIASRDEAPIRQIFNALPTTTFYLHEVETELVAEDIRKYVEKSLADIVELNGATQQSWPSPQELSAFLAQCGKLFIYAATAIRYINDEDGNYQRRLSALIDPTKQHRSALQTAEIDDLYGQIMENACNPRLNEPQEIAHMKECLAAVIFAFTPLTVAAISHLLKIDASSAFSAIRSLIHVASPVSRESLVTVFHASFPDFITDPTRCSPTRCPSFQALQSSEEHSNLAIKCLRLMNNLLQENMCAVSGTLSISRKSHNNSPHHVSKIPRALQYACLYWMSHVKEIGDPNWAGLNDLYIFMDQHLLHWIECLSILGELQVGVDSLIQLATCFLKFSKADTDYLALLKDFVRYLQLSFQCIKQCCSESYRSGVVWVPHDSIVRRMHPRNSSIPRVIIGLPDSWSPTELVLEIGASVNSIAVSQDGTRVACGSNHNIIHIWNAYSGNLHLELRGHMALVNSVAFSPNGSQLVSCSDDGTVWIWNALSGHKQQELTGHSQRVNCVAFSPTGKLVVTGSDDKLIRLYDPTSGNLTQQLKGHTHIINTVAFSPDSTLLVSGANNGVMYLWDIASGEVQFELKSSRSAVTSLAFSPDGTQIASASGNQGIQIWDSHSGMKIMDLKTERVWISSVAWSPDSNRVVSGSYDNLVKIWDAMTGEIEVTLKGHTNTVESVVFTPDGQQIVTASADSTIRFWSIASLGGLTHREGHSEAVIAVAFSLDGNWIASGSRDTTICLWNALTGELEQKLTGHAGFVHHVAFASNSTIVISGSTDDTIRVWFTLDHEVEVVDRPTVNLPNGTKIHRVDPGEFSIEYQPTPMIQKIACLSEDHAWIISATQDCWIPPEYRDPLSVAVWGEKICFGYHSGRVVIVDMA
ncbi:WD40-repeat-containing domain protein [Favolaschia claudopus]|uniref:WD40-repeat-containing domain protein n=1 Tax=Favolaschia claudopus TaxID=2862362 RepID=A0AAV9ZXI4_9AGAR